MWHAVVTLAADLKAWSSLTGVDAADTVRTQARGADGRGLSFFVASLINGVFGAILDATRVDWIAANFVY